jgi:hypothetical protein
MNVNFREIFSLILRYGPAIAAGILPESITLPNGDNISAYGSGTNPTRLTLPGILLALEEAKSGVPSSVTIGTTVFVYTPKGIPVIGPSAHA